MSAGMREFRQRAQIALEDARLQNALENATGRFWNSRREALERLPDSDGLRDHFKEMRAATLADLAPHRRTFEKIAEMHGTRIHWAQTGEEASRILLQVAGEHGAKLAVKSKSMTSEEIRLNHSLEASGIQTVETDLGEWIVQLAGEDPSHIIAPAIHKTKEQVADLFEAEAGKAVPADIPKLTEHARRRLRGRFLKAGIGISGVNIAVAESGSLVLVTNEGNGRMVTSLPPVHVAIVGIEKIAPTWADAAVWLSLLARSATGQPLSIYTNVITGPRQVSDPDGPLEVHLIVLDNGRSDLLGTKYEEALQCIRCGACLNVCPVYREAGGHAYGSPYSGPIGAVISPLLFGLERNVALPQASSLCGACLDVCPARIDLPRMLIELRSDSVEKGLLPAPERIAELAAARVLEQAGLMELAGKIGRIGQRFASKNLPKLADQSFREWWRNR